MLPGQGAFQSCMDGLNNIDGMVDVLEQCVLKNKVPFLGICIGMQLLADESYENGKHKGLGWIGGSIKKLFGPNLKLPHMGWNSLEIERQNNFLEGVNDGSWVYFVHSYMIKTKETGLIAANADYGIKVPAVIQQKNFIGTQFHPEKSGKIGSLMLSNFLSECKK